MQFDSRMAVHSDVICALMVHLVVSGLGTDRMDTHFPVPTEPTATYHQSGFVRPRPTIRRSARLPVTRPCENAGYESRHSTVRGRT